MEAKLIFPLEKIGFAEGGEFLFKLNGKPYRRLKGGTNQQVRIPPGVSSISLEEGVISSNTVKQEFFAGHRYTVNLVIGSRYQLLFNIVFNRSSAITLFISTGQRV
jgi:hypothetical protein